ncbi:MAG: hypothetical protein JW889_14360 [Verrucomicrobia bacterium]|nr:hypothetical protein [Verrucomicrobiota bacterium]
MRRLQTALVARFDEDSDGVLGASELEHMAALGIGAEHLTSHRFDASLDELVAAAHTVEILPRPQSAHDIRRSAWRVAQANLEETMAPVRAEIESLSAWWAWPDYTATSTWKAGLAAFYEQFLLRYIHVLLGNPFHWIPFLAATYLAALIAAILLRGRRVLAALVTTIVISGVVNGLWAVVLPHNIRAWGADGAVEYWLLICGDSLLILAVAIAGARRGASFSGRPTAFRVSLLLLGVLLVAWGILPTPGYALRPGFHWWFPFLLSGEIRDGMKTWICAIGLLVLLADAILLVTHRRLRRQRRFATA